MRHVRIIVLAAFCLALQLQPGFAQERRSAVADSTVRQNQDGGAKTVDGVGEQKTDAEQTYSVDPVVVTATRMETPISQVTKSIDVVTGKQMENQQQIFFPEALTSIPGVMFEQQGGLGQYSTIDIRGAGSQHVQFQFNGIPLRDAADTQNTLQYFTEDLFGGNGLNRIEVLKGTNSTLYGSAAMGGVVNIITKKWQQGFSAELRSMGGEHNSFLQSGSFSYGEDNYYLNVNPTYVTTDGAKNGGKYGYYFDNVGFTAGGGVKIGNNMALEFTNMTYSSDLALSAISPSLDAQHNLIVNQASKDSHREGLINLTGLNFSQQVSDLWDYSVKGAYGMTQRHYFWSSTTGDRSNYDGSTTYIEMQHNIHATDWLTLTMGFDYDGATYDGREPKDVSTQSFQDYNENWFGYDLFGQAQLAFFDKSLFFTGGMRFNDHQKFDSKVVWETSAAYIFKQTGTKIHTAFATGYRTPSLYEIYGGYLYNGQVITIGNPNLQPEESMSYEAGVTQSFLDNKLTAGVTWFHIDFDDLITYDGFNNKYMNANKGKTDGIEAKIDAKLCKYFTIGAAYTYAYAKYKETESSQWSLREYWPKNTFSIIGTVFPIDRLTASIKVSWEDDKIVPLYDTSYNKVLWKEKSNIRVDLASTYKVLKNYKQVADLDLFLRVENLFDEDYTESGYTMPGRCVFGGLKMAF